MKANHYLTHFAASLAAQRNAHVEQTRRVERNQKPEKLDYVATIRRWWNDLAPATRQHPWSLETIATAAFTDPDKRPAMRFVASALRELGFVETRDWTKHGRNRRYWTPPSTF